MATWLAPREEDDGGSEVARVWDGGGPTICWGTMAAVAKLLFRDQGVDPLFLVVVRAYLATFTLFAVVASRCRSGSASACSASGGFVCGSPAP